MTHQSRFSRACIGRLYSSAPLVLVLVGMALALGVGCFSLTSNFDDVAGVRPADAGGESTTTGESDAGDGAAGTNWPFGTVDCSQPHLLCTNFDLGGGLTQGGWSVDTNNGSEALVDGTRSVSSPASFRSKIPAVPGKTNVGAIIRQVVRVGTWAALRYGFDMFISACSTMPQGSTTLSALQAGANTAFGIVLDVDGTYVFAQLLLDQGQFKPHKLAKQPPLNKWFRVETRIELSTTAGRMQVFFDGTSVLDEAPELRAQGTDILLNVGANASGPVGKCDVNYDNVTFDKE